jgi:hypothetical protein
MDLDRIVLIVFGLIWALNPEMLYLIQFLELPKRGFPATVFAIEIANTRFSKPRLNQIQSLQFSAKTGIYLQLTGHSWDDFRGDVGFDHGVSPVMML